MKNAIRVLLSGIVLSVTVLMGVATPAAATLVPFRKVHGVQCLFPPGVYAIVDARGNLVGALIVYPDCTVEIVPEASEQPT